MNPQTEHHAAHDLLRVLQVGLPRGAHLLLPAEQRVAEGLQQLPIPVLDSWARAIKRAHPIQRLTDVDAGQQLIEHGLASPIQGHACLERLTVPELAALLRAQGRSVRRSARRAQLLEAALTLPEVPLPVRFVRIEQQLLWLRLWRCFTLRAFPDPDLPVLQRLGIRSWPDYRPTGGAMLWSDRAHLLAWEALADTLLTTTEPEPLLDAPDRPAASAPGRLDLRRPIRRRLWELASELESTEPERASRCFQSLLAHPDRYAHRARLRLAMLHERNGAPDSGLALLRQARPGTTGWRRLALNRTGRRLARVCRDSWAPDRPLASAHTRRIPLPVTASDGPRPRFDGMVVEHAVVHRLQQLGRIALHSEGGLWRHLFALVFAPHCYFAPVHGALPAPFLPGPLDLGTPAFAERRAAAIQATWQQVRSGQASELVRTTHARYAGTHLAGARWDRTVDEDVALVEAIGPAVLERVLGVLLERGLRAARGLPDLLILGGPGIEWPHAHPRRIGPSLCFAEVKTPNDSLSDPQRWWLAHLRDVARVEVWQVQPERHTRHR